MSKRVATVIEIGTFIVFGLLAVRWAWTQNGWFEPYTVICGFVFIGLELYRRYLAKDEAKTTDSSPVTTGTVEVFL